MRLDTSGSYISGFKKPVFNTLSFAILAATLALPLQASLLEIDQYQQESLSLTLYNQDMALIEDIRRLPILNEGQRLNIKDVSPRMLPETLRIQGAGTILEQSLQLATLNFNSLLQAYLGKPLQLARLNPATGQESILDGELLSIDGAQAIFRIQGRLETVPLHSEQWRFLFPEIPQELQPDTRLSFRTSGTLDQGEARFTYITQGMGWQMDYVLTLNQDASAIAIEGLASLYNNSGAHYENAHISLMAGDIQRPEAPRGQMMRAMAVMESDSYAQEPESVQDYHLYRMPQTLSLHDQEHKQVPLIQIPALAAGISYQHQFMVYPFLDQQRYSQQPDIMLSFRAPAGNEAAAPLPAGQARVFRPDAKGELQFIGASRIGNIAAGEEVEMTLGRAFDLSISRQQTHYSKTFDGHLVEQQISVSNSSENARALRLSAGFQQQWEIQESSLPHQEDGAGNAYWVLDVPARESVTLTLKVALKDRKS
ncbi:DUF4139 domain-containing protein [Nitrincola alkalilacustris]|uniref:DUF4139 domain-containing protein n=1 Tax=Nitrincola alkalilacustris TaxID=1571224 RepID=UPI00124D9C5D|nr:DUF4139 domain-containing protein [Nitrincola alkalilacustris]